MDMCSTHRGPLVALVIACCMGQVALAEETRAQPAVAPEAAAGSNEGDGPSMAPVESDDGPSMAPPDEPEQAGWHAKVREAGFTGSLRGAYWSSNRRANDEDHLGVGQLWGKFDRKLMKGPGAFVEGYVGREDLFGDRLHTTRIREGYLDWRFNEWDFRVGKQIIAWGRTDRLNPTDNLTPRDFTLLDPEFDEDRFGSIAARASFNWGRGNSVTGVWIPEFRSHVYGFSNNPAVVWRHTEPDRRRQLGIKYDVSGGDIDYSVSYYDGFDLTPDMAFEGITATGARRIGLDHNRIQVIGSDAATTVGSNRYAVEIAYTRTRDTQGDNPAIKNPHLYAVAGLEHDFTNNLTGIVQYFYRHVYHHRATETITDLNWQVVATNGYLLGSQYDRNLHGLSARVGKKWFNETLEGEFAGSVQLNRHGYFLRAKMTYIWSDEIKLIGGYEFYSGSDVTSFGRQERNKALFAEIRYFF
ncbi:MAG: hypothetical protein FJY37_06610 [Betaproteobacteria bacterium]|nr:hypothetical protein [Betaproteobacteria bacterium]